MNLESRITDLFKESVAILKRAHIPSPQLDAKIIFKSALNISETDFYQYPDKSITLAQRKKIKELIARRTQNEPIAYIIGQKEFLGFNFFVDKNVLIPRPETEELVEMAIDRINNEEAKIMHVLDMGTGSGNIIISIAKKCPTAICSAADISDQALVVAKKNASYYKVDRINFYQSDLFANPQLPDKFDLIIANLPYVPKIVKSQKLKIKSDIDFEPQNAIFAYDQGMAIIKDFLEQAKTHVAPGGGATFLELDPRNAIQIKEFAKEMYHNYKVELFQDLAGFNRFLTIKPL